jgi:hypothetical protein
MLRYVFNAPSHVRCSLLYLVGKGRCLSSIEGQLSSSLFIEPLLASLKLSISTAHSWSHMKLVLLELATCYGDLDIRIEGLQEVERMRLSSMYTTTAARVSGMLANLLEYSLSLVSEKPATLPADVNEILNGIIITNRLVTTEKRSIAPRDIYFHFRSVIQSCDSLWKDGFEWDLCQDLHAVLNKGHANYNINCVVSKLPDIQSYLPIDESVTTAWRLDGGSFPPSYIGYIVLGAIVAGAPPKDKKKPVAAVVTVCKPREAILKKINVSPEAATVLSVRATKLSQRCDDSMSSLLAKEAIDLLRDISEVLTTSATAILKAEIEEEANQITINVHFYGQSESLVIPITKCLLLGISKIFDVHHDVNSATDNAICSFMHSLFEFKAGIAILDAK